MRAMVCEGPVNVEEKDPLALRERDVPEPGEGQVRVRVLVCGVCRTDLHVVEGDLPEKNYPIVPGHEVVGVVDALGKGVENLKENDRVGVAWVGGTDGSCPYCERGDHNLCENPTFTGYTTDGGYADHVLVQARYTYPIPETFGDEEVAPLLCAGIIGYRALNLSEVKPGQRLGLYGFGGSAHIVIQIAVHRGCEVYVCTRDENSRKLAMELGAVWTGGSTEQPPEKLHGSILFAPAGEIVPPALRALDRGGTLACAGIHMSPIPEIDYDSELFYERTLRSVTANTREDGEGLLREAAEIPIRPRTTVYDLSDANQALRDLKAARFVGAAVLRVADEK